MGAPSVDEEVMKDDCLSPGVYVYALPLMPPESKHHRGKRKATRKRKSARKSATLGQAEQAGRAGRGRAAGQSKTASGTPAPVRVKGAYIEISWPYRSGMSLTLKHHDLELVEPPPFLSDKLLMWVQNGLRTMKDDLASKVRTEAAVN